MDEFVERLSLGGPHCLFDVHGELGVFLEAFLEIKIPLGFTKITIFDKTFELFRKTLLEYNYTCHPGDPPQYADLVGDTLYLNVGPRSGNRLHGDTADSHPNPDEPSQPLGETIEVKRVKRDLDNDGQKEDYYHVFFNGVPDVQKHPDPQYDDVRIDRLFPASAISRIVADGGAGTDRIIIRDGVTADLDLKGGDHRDEIKVLVQTGTTPGAVTIMGGAGDDLIVGGEGNELIYGGIRQRHDRRRGGARHDFMEKLARTGSPAKMAMIKCSPETMGDRISGGEGNDLIRGGSGNDIMSGDAGDDWLYGEGNDDELTGESGADMLDGGSGKDQLTGGIGIDVMLGGAHDDTFNWRGRRSVDGDLVQAGDAVDDFIVGGGGSDKLFITSAHGNDAETVLVSTVAGVTTSLTWTDPTGANLTFTRPSTGISAAMTGSTLDPTLTISEMEIFHFDVGAGADTVEVYDLSEANVASLDVDLGLSSGSTISHTPLMDPLGDPMLWTKSASVFTATETEGEAGTNEVQRVYHNGVDGCIPTCLRRNRLR